MMLMENHKTNSHCVGGRQFSSTVGIDSDKSQTRPKKQLIFVLNVMRKNQWLSLMIP